MMKKVTKATAKAAVRRYAADLPGAVEVDSDTVTLWYTDPADDVEREKVEAAASAIAKHCGRNATNGNGSKVWVYYRREPVDMGDYMDKSSRWHY